MSEVSTVRTFKFRNHKIGYSFGGIRRFIYAVSDLFMAIYIMTTIKDVNPEYITIWAPIWVMLKAYYATMWCSSIIHFIKPKED